MVLFQNQPEQFMETYSGLNFEPRGLPPNHHFIVDAIEGGQLKIAATEGFESKSGRISPYFFNSGLYVKGSELTKIAQRYANTLVEVHGNRLEGCVLFGPPYKGIALANATAIQLYDFHMIDVLVASNRKEPKLHGERGVLMGADMAGKNVIIIDDVITNGTSKRDAVQHIRSTGGHLMGGIIAFDRQEKGTGKDGEMLELSGAQEFQKEYGCPMHSIATFADLITVFETYPAEEGDLHAAIASKLKVYRDQYGAKL